MITKEKPVQTCDIDRHKVHEFSIKRYTYVASQQLCDILHIINLY